MVNFGFLSIEIFRCIWEKGYKVSCSKKWKKYFDAGCNGKKLETAAQSQDMFGCTIIVNHLEIRITRGSKYKLYLVG